MKLKLFLPKIILLLIISDNITFSQVDFKSSNLPICIIDTDSQKIENSVRIVAKMGMIFNSDTTRNFITDSLNNYNGNIEIEIRGSSSLQFPKKSYRIETQDSNGENNNVSLLRMPKENDWVLHAPYSDKTFLRNVFAYHLANNMGHYASRTNFCELILNNEYQGIYVLMEKVKKDKNRVNVAELELEDSLGDDITGGYIIKIDKDSGEDNDGWETEKVFYQYHYPKPDEITDKQKSYIQDYIANFEEVFVKISKNDTVADPYEFYDINSFVDYFLINEICRNIDGYRFSTYMYKDRDSKNGKIKMGPIWDYNLSLANARYYEGYNPVGWNLDLLLSKNSTNVPFWWKTIRSDSVFQKKVFNRWNELRPSILDTATLFNFIDDQAKLLNEAQERNFTKWPILGITIWPNKYVGDSYQSEIDILKNWLRDRLEWLDETIRSYDPTTYIEIERKSNLDSFILDQNYPNPFNPKTVIRFYLPKHSYVKLNVYNTLGEKVKTLLSKHMHSGKHEIEFDAAFLSSGIYFYKIEYDYFNAIKKMILLK